MSEHVRMWDYAELYYTNGSRIPKCCLEFYTSNAFPNQKLYAFPNQALSFCRPNISYNSILLTVFQTKRSLLPPEDFLEFYTSNVSPNQKLSFVNRMFLIILYFERVSKPSAFFLLPDCFLQFYTSNGFPNQTLAFAARRFLGILYF